MKKKNRKNPEFMHFTIPAAELKQQGYTFQKLFARNYICYHKDTPKKDLHYGEVLKKAHQEYVKEVFLDRRFDID